MNFLSDVITYIRRLVKTPSNQSLTDALIIDYINRFWIMDVDARIQLFDLKTTYQFQTIPGITSYNMPLYYTQTETTSPLQTIGQYPVYQGFMLPCYLNGIQFPFYNERQAFWNIWPDYVNPLQPVATGDGITSTFKFNVNFFPAIPGYVDMSGIIALGNFLGAPVSDPFFTSSMPTNSSGFIPIPTTSFYPRVYVVYTDETGNTQKFSDSGIFLSTGNTSQLYGLLMQLGTPGLGNSPMPTNTYSTTQNTINYATGEINITFPSAPPIGAQIQVQSYFYEQGIPRAMLFFNNCMELRPPPNTQYLVEVQGYLTPAAFMNTSAAIPFAYMAEYIARGAARKILADTGDVEQFAFYEPLFKEQETLVWKRSQRQFTATRTGTIFSDLQGQNNYNTQSGLGTA